jgi:hypothetical protein
MYVMIPAESLGCPIGLDPDSIEAVKEAMQHAAEYVKGKLGGVDPDGGDILDEIVKAVREGRIEWAEVIKDLKGLDS